MSSKIKRNVWRKALLLCILFYCLSAFNFKEIKVTPASTTTNVITTYTFFYDRTITNSFSSTAYLTTPLTASSTVTLTFPNQYILPSNVACLYQINSIGTFLPNACTLNTNQIIYSGIFSAGTILASITLQVNNVLNPIPAGKTSNFAGTIGADVAVANGVQSFATITPAVAVCSFTFSPNYVYSSGNMIFTLTTVNVFPSTGTIGIQFPLTKIWSQELDNTRTMPIIASMVCNSQSSNVNSAVQCSGSSALVTLTNIVSSSLSASSTISFSINNFIAPPTNQAADSIVVTTYTGGSAIDTCNAYVTGLIPKTIPSSQFLITEADGNSLVVNRQFTIKFEVGILDIISPNDYFVITFPTGTSITSFSTATVGGTVVFNTVTSTYFNQVLTLFMMSGAGNLSPQSIFITVSNFIAPPSTQTTSNFELTIMSNGSPKMISSQSITATAGPLSGTVSMSATTVNVVNSYSFIITTNNPLTSTGQIKITFPTVLTFTNQPTYCAVVTNMNNMVSGPACTFSSIDNSITFTSLTSSTSNIPAQTMTITVNNIKNPPSTATTPNFVVSTYYTSSLSSMVDTGTISGVTATVATIDYTKVVISSSSLITSDTAVTYYFSFIVDNPIPVGGTMVLSYPLGIRFDLSITSNCFIMFNSGTRVSTPCSSSQSTNYIFTYTNPLPSSPATAGMNITLVVASSATNPPSTQQVGPFSLQTYSSDGTIIASLLNALSYQVTAPNSFSYNQFARISNQNAATTSYTITLTQIATLQPSDLLFVTLPASLVASSSSTCSMTYLSSTSVVTCTLTLSTFRIVSLSTSITGGTIFSITLTNIKNPLSYGPLTGFLVTSKTATNAYFYSSSSSTNSLSNSVPSLFKAVTYLYSPQQLNTAVVLILTFELSQYTLMPGYLLVTIDSYFGIGTLSCSAFVDFTGSCTSVASQTIKISGTFSSSVMGLTISGFTSQTVVPPSATYTIVNSFDASGYKMDESSQTISFQLACTLPCQTCSSTSTSSCLSCYTNTLVTTSIFFMSSASQCYTTCPATTYNNIATSVCSNCASNCLNCLGSATFCTKCVTTSGFPYLNVASVSIQTCVAACTAGMYPNMAVDPAKCTLCSIPCLTCTTQTICLSCSTGFYFLGGTTCVPSCPTGTTVANTLTNTCDVCSSICLTCAGSTSTCTACNSPLVFYSGSCQASCPSGGTLAPNLGICTACVAICQTCSTSITNCTSCKLASGFPYFVANSCIASCPIFFYNQSSTGSCISCASANINCVNCLSSSTCYTCDNSFVFLSASCLSSVPAGYVNISGIAVLCNSNCATCSITTTACTSCLSLNLLGTVCTANCNSNMIPINRVCVTCSTPCLSCSVALFNCTACLPNLATPLFLTSFSCQATCPDFTYPNTSTYQCSPCISPCNLCSTYTTCTSCINGTSLFFGSCLAVCPTGYAVVNRICQPCTNNCKTCINATNICLNCNNGSYFLSSSSSCVTSCQPSLFIDYPTQSCVGCTSPCNTCINSSTTCLSCLSGYNLYQSSCLSTCPNQMFYQGGTCLFCPQNCSSCSSLTNCSACAGTTYLYNTYCVASCPATKAAIINGVCESCSTLNCYSCTTSDVCLMCASNYLYLKAMCLSSCPTGYNSNGTHCLDILAASLSTSNAFPVPFSIAGIVFIIACLMSRLQFNQTYMSGAIYSLLSILEWAALLYMLYLYFIGHMDQPIPIFVGLGSLALLYILNIAAIISQSIFLCSQKAFQLWAEPSRFNRCFYVFATFVSLLVNHKFRNILFCKLFTFGVFCAKLDKVDHFRIFNIFSLVSLVPSGAAIFAAGIAITKTDPTQQLYFECIDVIVLTSINAVMAFFNTHKDKDFFNQITLDGYTLHKKNLLDQQLVGDKFSAHGHDGEVQGGLGNTYSHALNSKAALQFDNDSSNYEVYSDNSLGNIVEKSYEQISVQALDIIDDKANATAKTNPHQQSYQPQYQEISIQACDMIFSHEKQDGINLSDVPQGFENDTSNFTNYMHRVDQSVQGNLTKGVNQSIQMGPAQADRSVQNQRKLEDNVDISIQKTDKIERADFSIQKFEYGQDVSVQNSDRRNDISIQPSRTKQTDQSVAMTYKPAQSHGVQQNVTMSDKNYSAQVSVRNQSNQLSQISQYDQGLQIEADVRQEGIQPSIEYEEYGIQPTLEYNQVGVQPTLEVQDEDEQLPEYNQIAVQYQDQDQVQFNEFQNELHNSHTASHVIFEQEATNGMEERKLVQQKVEPLQIQPQNIISYQEELEERIRQKQKQLQQIKRKVDLKEKLNQLKKEELSRKRHVQHDDIQFGAIQYVGKPKTESIKSKTIQEIQVQPVELQRPSNIDYRQSPYNIASQSEQHASSFYQQQSLAKNQLKEEYIQPPERAMFKKQPEQIKFQYAEVPNHLQNLMQEEPIGFVRSKDREGFSSQIQSQGNLQSQSTKKNYPRRNVVVDVSQIDRSLEGEDIQYDESQSGHEPTGIITNLQHAKPRFREPDPSDMSGTIEEIPQHYLMIDDQKTVTNNQIEHSRAMPVTSRIDKQKVTSFLADNMANPQRDRRGHQMPVQNDGTERFHINKLYSKNQLAHKKNQDSFPRNVQREKKNTFAMAGQAQFNTEDIIKKKGKSNNPLKNQKNWEAQHQDKYISDEEPEKQPNTFNRTNLVKRPVNKNLQNFASHLVLPQESDKQDTTFHQMAQKKEEKVSRKAREFSAFAGKKEAEEIEVHFQADQFQQKMSAKGNNESPNMPQAYNKRLTSNVGQSSFYDDESQDNNYKKMMILGQMQQRPNNDDLQGYYQRKRDSKQKPRRSNSKIDRTTEKIYLQRFDKTKK